MSLPGRILRLALVVALLLMVPLVAMRFDTGVDWTLLDFVVAGILLFGAGLTYELVAMRGTSRIYRAAVGLAVFSALFLVWATLAVGLIGTERDRASLMYLAVLAVGAIGALLARFRPLGMARTLFAMAVVHALIGGIAYAFGMGLPESTPFQLAGVTGVYVMLFAGAGLLFLLAARQQRCAAVVRQSATEASQ